MLGTEMFKKKITGVLTPGVVFDSNNNSNLAIAAVTKQLFYKKSLLTTHHSPNLVQMTSASNCTEQNAKQVELTN